MIRHLVIIFCLLSCLKCFPQTQESHFIKKYTPNDGLSSYNVRNIVQDPMGFTWIATQAGLNLFDGKTFTKYTNNSPKEKKISGTDIHSLVVDTPRHLIWVLNPEMVINAINYQTGQVVKTAKGERNGDDDWSIAMVLFNNRLWIGSSNGLKIYNTVTDKWEQWPAIPFKKNKQDDIFSARTVYADAYGNIWVFVNHYGILVIDPKSQKIIKTIYNTDLTDESQASFLNFTSAINLSPSQLLVGTSAGLKLIEYDNKKGLRPDGKLPDCLMALANHRITAMAKSANSVYIADGTDLYRIDNQERCVKIKESNTSGNESWLNDIATLHIDDANNVWIGCKQGLAFLSSYQSAFENFSNKSYLNSGLNHVYNIMPLPDGNIIVGQEKGLLKYNHATDKFEAINSTKAFNFSFRDFNNRLIVSADDGLYILNNNNLTPVTVTYPELKPVADCDINSYVTIGDSLYIIGSDNSRGIFLWNYKKGTLKIINNASSPIRLKSNIVKKVFRDSKGRIWVLSDFGIDIIDKSLTSVKYITVKNPSTGEPLGLYFDICEVNGKFWLANYSFGIIETDFNGKPLRLLNSANGLCNDGVYKIFNRVNKNLIITSNNGLSVFNIADSTFTNYYEQDGLHSNSFEENCGVDKDGKIYAGGLNGFTVIDPKLLFINKTPPKLYFSDIKIDAQLHDMNVKDLNIKSLTVPNDVLQTTISFSGLNYSNPNRVTYNYKIEELNSQWVDLGAENFVNIIGISPGNYHLLVRAANENGVWNEKPLRLLLTFLPKWYQTWWFKLVIVLIVCGILYIIYLYRIKQLRVQQEIRRGIANDLHDDLGSTLNSIKIFTHLALSKEQDSTHLNEIQKSITAATMGLRDMLWVLEGTRDNLDELIERTKKFADPIADAQNINIHYEINGVLGEHKITKTEKKNLLLILKEAINNSFKYAACQNIKVIIGQNGNKIYLKVTDDGAGFSTADHPPGYGLNNIQYRATQIGYRFQVTSSPGNGTIITVEKR